MDALMPVLLLAFLIFIIILDKKKILQYNKLPIFLIYLYITPLLFGLLIALLFNAQGLFGEYPFLWDRKVSLVATLLSLLAGCVLCVFALRILIKICKDPIDEKAVTGSYDADRLKRLTLYKRAAFIPSVIILAWGIATTVRNLTAISVMSYIGFTSPAIWLLSAISAGLPLYAVAVWTITYSTLAIAGAIIVGSVGIWLYLVYLAFSYVQLFRLYRLGEIDRKRLLKWGLGLLIFPINLFMSPMLTKTAKRAIANREEKYKQQQEQGINRETAKIVSAEAIWGDTKPTGNK